MDLQWRNILPVVTLAAAITPAFAQGQTRTSIPDFSGLWVHANPGYEPLASGPTSLINLSRRPNGTGDILKLAGDYTNPILKHHAAEVVKQYGELGRNGIGAPNPRNQCWPAGVPFVFSNGPTQLVQLPDKVVILFPPRALEPIASH